MKTIDFILDGKFHLHTPKLACAKDLHEGKRPEAGRMLHGDLELLQN